MWTRNSGTDAVTWHKDAPQGNEAAKVRFDIVPYTRGTVLDLGCGPSKAFPHFLGVDSGKDTELFGTPIKPDIACDAGDPAAFGATFNSLSVDAIFSSHLLEHIEDAGAALAAWWDAIKVGGYLVLYLPHRDLYPNIGTHGANPDHKHDFHPDDVMRLMARVGGWELLVNETRAAEQEYSFLQVYRKCYGNTQSLAYRCPRPPKTACVVRFGGFGDMIQAANILPALKREGFHVTVMTTPKGQDILAHDPHVDGWIIQDGDQVPNHELTDYWKVWAAKFDRFVNLSESVEGTMLAMPGRINYGWPAALRRRVMWRNYLEFTADLAEVPYASEGRFYPTDIERKWAQEFYWSLRLKAFGREPRPMEVVPQCFNILWCLAGSSVHKMYPHQDTVIARVLREIPEAVFTLVGDAACVILEGGWEKHQRIQCASGELSIRRTLTLAQQADCVVGPETGVLNAVAFEPMPKVLMLSHSSHENLSKHWVNTEAVAPPTACHPCHRMHYGRDFCPEHEPTGAALCAWETDPGQVFAAIERGWRDWRTLRELRTAA